MHKTSSGKVKPRRVLILFEILKEFVETQYKHVHTQSVSTDIHNLPAGVEVWILVWCIYSAFCNFIVFKVVLRSSKNKILIHANLL